MWIWSYIALDQNLEEIGTKPFVRNTSPNIHVFLITIYSPLRSETSHLASDMVVSRFLMLVSVETGRIQLYIKYSK